MNWRFGRRPGPQVVVHARGHVGDRRVADRVAPLVAQPARHVDLADQALAHLLHAFLHRFRRADLAALLHHAVVLARRRHNLPGFEDVVRARLLHVNVLARLAGPDGLQCMPVVGRGDGDGVDGLVVQELAHILEALRRFLPAGFHALYEIGHVRLVDIRNGHQLHVGQSCPFPEVAATAASTPHNGDAHSVVGTGKHALSGSHRRRGAHKKVSSIHGSPREPSTLLPGSA